MSLFSSFTSALDAVSAYSASMGTFGDIVFEVSDVKALTFNDLTRSGGSEWGVQAMVKGKPRAQYLHPKLRSVSFTIKLHAQHGTKPRKTLDQLMKMAEGYEAYRLVINGKPLSDLPWRLTSVSESWGHMYNRGELVTAEVSLSLEEYK